MTGLLETVGGLLERRLLRTTWLPILLFGALMAALVAAAHGWVRTQHRWESLSGDLQALGVILLVAATVVLAQLLDAVRPSVIRLYEGYWSALPYGDRIAARLRVRHEDPVARTERPWTLPTPDRLMPTRFGNIIRAAEQEAQRYGMDAATVWPRLYVTLPEAFTAHFAAAAAALDLMVTISMLGAGFAVLGGAVAVILLPWYMAVLCLVGGALTAWLGYHAAVRAAFVHGELIRTAFDVHRWLLLDAMGLQRPASLGAERKQWQQIHQVWQRGFPDADQAVHLGYPPRPPAQSGP